MVVVVVVLVEVEVEFEFVVQIVVHVVQDVLVELGVVHERKFAQPK
ncbi:hypothetical protein A2U01_0088224, partial [Trifolium medium]|nr:hypothetical protein [Trifolium medium]